MDRRGCRAARIVLLVLAGIVVPSQAIWRVPTKVPVARLVENLTAHTKEHPQDAEGFYLLGRAHGLAFTKRLQQVSVWNREPVNDKDLPEIADNSFQRDTTSDDDPRPVISSKWLATHMSGAVKAFERAIELDPTPAHYHLGYAFVLESGITKAAEADVVPGATPLKDLDASRRSALEALVRKLKSEDESERERAKKSLKEQFRDAAMVLLGHARDSSPLVREVVQELLSDHWRERAIEHYYRAFAGAIETDRTITEQPMRGLSTLISYEAGTAFVRLMRARGPRTDEDEKRLDKAVAALKELEAKPKNMAMTPIVFSFERAQPLGALLDRSRIVFFDLDGDGIPEARPWVRPGASFLVWDPDGTGEITSGRQLFGSVTWWFFFSDGYRALDALDDSRDGRLTGDELAGLGVWTDFDADGVSDPGEVVAIDRTGITAVSTRFSSFELDCPAEPRGLVMRDGSTRPTYDWIVPGAPSLETPRATGPAWSAGNSPPRAPRAPARDRAAPLDQYAILARERDRRGSAG